MKDLLIYGANGYTGDLIARHAAAKGHRPVLAGRSEHKIRPLAEELGLEHRIFGLDDAEKNLAGFKAVLHCAGPFSRTARPMVDACVATGTHYLDITGEIAVFEALAARSQEFSDANVMVMPGVGCDVVPSDCLAVHVAALLPTATHLELALFSTGGMSHGTATTALEGIADGGAVRRDGKICKVPSGHKTRHFDFGRGPKPVISIPWGDVSTAFYSTGVPNIVVYFALPAGQRLGIKAGRWVGGLLAKPAIRSRIQARIDAGPPGPTDEKRARSKLHLVAEVSDSDGTVVSARLHTPGGYTITMLAAVLIAEKVLAGEYKPGFQTPASCYGADLVMEIEGVTREDL
jgi:short subunit dehydrogenase-like uncharacterized protein